MPSKLSCYVNYLFSLEFTLSFHYAHIWDNWVLISARKHRTNMLNSSRLWKKCNQWQPWMSLGNIVQWDQSQNLVPMKSQSNSNLTYPSAVARFCCGCKNVIKFSFRKIFSCSRFIEHGTFHITCMHDRGRGVSHCKKVCNVQWGEGRVC